MDVDLTEDEIRALLNAIPYAHLAWADSDFRPAYLDDGLARATAKLREAAGDT